jgi:hypothetical protein
VPRGESVNVMKLSLVLLVAALALGLTACGKTANNAVSSSQRPPSAASVKGSSTSTSSSATEKQSSPPQNDDYISTYGHEAREPERHEIAEMVNRYYREALAGDGSLACSLVYSTLAKSVAQEYGASVGLSNSNCSTVLPKLFQRAPGLYPADLASTRVTGVRVRGRNGFVQLSSRGMPTGEIAIAREGRSWKLIALVGRSCRRCSAGR